LVAAIRIGGIYVYRAVQPGVYVTGVAGEYGRLEVETGSTYHPWCPAWTWAHNGERFWVVQWWFIAAAVALPLGWSWWRRRKAKLRGFDVNQLTVPGDQML
jgi:hypothetical protein